MGLTDSDDFDSFIIERIKGKYVLKYKIHQPISNIRLLYHIKKILGYGKVIKLEAYRLACFIISDRKVLNDIIFTVFDKYPLLTRKYFYYLRFKKAWLILENKSLTTEQQNCAIEKLNIPLPNDYVSPAILNLNHKSSHETIKSVLSMYWLTGFIEGRGNLDILSVQDEFKVEFSIQIKREEVLLNLIKRLLHISNKVIFEEKGWLLKTKQSRAIMNIINVFSSSGCKFRGIQSLYFKLWTKAFYSKKNIGKIHKIVEKLHKTNRI